MKYAETIHSSGTDLLALINDILDLSKIESGKMDVEIGSVPFTDLRDYCLRTFCQRADGKNLEFTIDLGIGISHESIHTDAKRLQQVLKNLLSNALKFTARGFAPPPGLKPATAGWSASHPALNRSKNVIAFSVADTGIGIPQEKQISLRLSSRRMEQTSRKYGGTGLGLSISRELARLLGGEIRLQSAAGDGQYIHSVSAAGLSAAFPQVGKQDVLRVNGSIHEDLGFTDPAPMESGLDVILPAPVSTTAGACRRSGN